MAHLWVQAHTGQWTMRPLEERASLEPEFANIDLRMGETPADRADRTAHFARADAATERVWLLISGFRSGVCVNGVPMAGRIRVLADRDEIQKLNRRFYFAADSPPLVVPLPSSALRFEPLAGAFVQKEPDCPRCKRPIALKMTAVQCPQCDTWHHESGDRLCWTISERCAVCSQATDLDAPYRWKPEET